jgi:hypothetical protein
MFSSSLLLPPGHDHQMQLGWLATLLAVVWFTPNTSQIFREKPARELKPRWQWSPGFRWGLLMGAIAVALLFQPVNPMRGDQAFIYFQF